MSAIRNNRLSIDFIKNNGESADRLGSKFTFHRVLFEFYLSVIKIACNVRAEFGMRATSATYGIIWIVEIDYVGYMEYKFGRLDRNLPFSPRSPPAIQPSEIDVPARYRRARSIGVVPVWK